MRWGPGINDPTPGIVIEGWVRYGCVGTTRDADRDVPEREANHTDRGSDRSPVIDPVEALNNLIQGLTRRGVRLDGILVYPGIGVGRSRAG